MSIFKKFIKNSNNIPLISKTIQHTPMTWCTYLQSFAKQKYINAFSSYSAKTKRDGQTDGWTDGQTDGRGRCNISRPGPSAPQEIKNITHETIPVHRQLIETTFMRHFITYPMHIELLLVSSTLDDLYHHIKWLLLVVWCPIWHATLIICMYIAVDWAYLSALFSGNIVNITDLRL